MTSCPASAWQRQPWSARLPSVDVNRATGRAAPNPPGRRRAAQARREVSAPRSLGDRVADRPGERVGDADGRRAGRRTSARGLRATAHDARARSRSRRIVAAIRRARCAPAPRAAPARLLGARGRGGRSRSRCRPWRRAGARCARPRPKKSPSAPPSGRGCRRPRRALNRHAQEGRMGGWWGGKPTERGSSAELVQTSGRASSMRTPRMPRPVGRLPIRSRCSGVRPEVMKRLMRRSGPSTPRAQ